MPVTGGGAWAGSCSALLAEIATHAELTTIRLWVTPTQHAARRFYASLGFREISNPDRGMLDGPGAHEEIAMEREANERSG